MIVDEPKVVSSPARTAPSAQGLRVIGLGDWGVQGAELFHQHGLPGRGVDIAAARALVADPPLGEALFAGADLVILVADLGGEAGSLAAGLLGRLPQIATRSGRLLLARLPSARSGTEERALGLVALNAVLEGPESGIFLVQTPEGLASEGDEVPVEPFFRLLDLWTLTSGEGRDPIRPLSESALTRFLATPGFLGWRETSLAADETVFDGRAWHERLAAVPWQPGGFAWNEAQAVLPLGKLPWTWLEGGGRRQFEHFTQAAWEHAAPCATLPALYAADPSAAIVVSAGMPYPQGLLTLRDSVEADRARLLEKRRKAAMPIPLGEGFAPEGIEAAPAPGPLRVEETPPRFEPAPREIPQPAPSAMPAAYESALALVRRIFSARDLFVGVDLGEVRYALYDLLEVVREEPQKLLPEVFRPVRHEYFERHHVNVAILAILTGDLLKESLSEVIDLGTAALLHDVGMLQTREVWEEEVRLPTQAFNHAIRPHPNLGFRRLQEIPGMTGSVAGMVLEEHERMDGTGYPQGLAGEAIDPGARILAVCDTLEALTHPRPYREALPPEEALTRLQALGQHALDPEVVQALSGELAELLGRGDRETERR